MLSTTRVRHELKFRQCQVIERTQLSPGFIALKLASPDLRDFPSQSFEDHCKLILQMEPERIMRDYTPRSFDLVAGTLTLEFALHAGGAASDWARNAKVGDRIAIGGPRGSTVFPIGYALEVLLGDETAIPAIARRLEELPAGTKVKAFVELSDERDKREFATKAAADITWLRAGTETLANAIRDYEYPIANSLTWAAGESASMRLVRDVLKARGITSAQSRVSAYWKRGEADHHEDIE